MEETGVMSEEAWSSLSGMYTSKDDSELLTQFFSGFSSSNDLSEIWCSEKEPSSLVCSSEFCNSNECLVSQETSTLSPDDGQSGMYLDGSFLYSDDVSEVDESHRLVASRMSGFGNYEMEPFEPVLYCPFDGETFFKSHNLRGLSDRYDVSDIGKLEKQELNSDQPRLRDLPNAPESKKRSRNSTDVTRSKRVLKSEKNQKIIIAENATENSLLSHSSEEHSSITQEIINGVTHTLNSSKTSDGKGKSAKGASSDPQSLYARKRRERINERLRILQGLVPNGTKVDISTMLEEAVHYVKFLQLQIKLLSSEDKWMYAPLAYNGMDIGIGNFDFTTSTSPR